jgi:Tfp pilus assembly protein PilO
MIHGKRDFTMVMIMLAVLLLGFTYLLAAPMITQWRESTTTRARLERDRGIAERLLNSRGDWEVRLAEARATLPRYGMTDPVGADLLRQVRRLADENRVVTTRISPGEEENIGDLYEQAIEVTWEAELEPLVRFLYAVQVAGATLDIRQMTMTPSQGEKLKGNLKIFFAYQRMEAASEERVEGGES